MGRKENRIRFEEMQREIEKDRRLAEAVDKSRKCIRILEEMPSEGPSLCEAGKIRFTERTLEHVLDEWPFENGECLILAAADPKGCGLDAHFGGNSTEAVLGRRTTFYACLENEKIRRVFENEQNRETFFYSDLCAYIPDIFLDSGENTVDVLYFYLPVLQMPRKETAFRDAAVVPTADKQREVLYARFEKLLRIAAAYGKRILLLEDFGCDTKYRCDARITAEVWGELMRRYRRAFGEICFRIESEENRKLYENEIRKAIE